MLHRICCVLLLLAALPLNAQQPPAAELSPAAKMWQRCEECHGVPDKNVPGDLLWAERIATTACIQPKAPKSTPERQVLQAWLLAAEQPRPQRIDAEAAAQADEGRISVPFAAGSVLLLPNDAVPNAARRPLRLVWTKAQGGTRALAAGRWRVAGYRLQRRDKENTDWQLWAAGGKGREFVIVAGQDFVLDIDQRVSTTVNWSSKGSKLQVGIAVQGDSGLGATMLRGGERVPARFVLRNGATTALAGDLDYG